MQPLRKTIRQRGWLASALAIGLLIASEAGAGLAATRPALSADEDIAGDIAHLGDASFERREEASRSLWSAGPAAAPALRRALLSDDPEIAGRARKILDKFDFGLFPDTPPDIFALLDQYRSGNPQLRQQAVEALASRGARGSRVLLGLRRAERDEQLRGDILKALAARAHEAAAMLLADDDAATAETLLSAAALSDANAARDYAALLLVHGGLDARILKLKEEIAAAPSPGSSALLVWLLRAKGDLEGAKNVARGAADASLVEHLMIEQGDWKELAGNLQARVARDDSVEELGFLAAYCRLAGDPEGLEKASAELVQFADDHSDQNWYAASALFLNDRPALATGVLLKHHNNLSAVEFLAARFQFDDALSLPHRALGQKPEIIMRLDAMTAPTQRFLGDSAAARKTLEHVADENRAVGDFGVWITLTRAAREAGEKKLADDYCAQGLAAAAPNDSIALLLETAGIPKGAGAAGWWRFLMGEKPTEPARETLHRLRALMTGAVPEGEVEGLAGRAQTSASKLGPEGRGQWLESIADVLEVVHHHESAERILRSIAKAAPSIHSLMRLGDSEADRGDWADAASSFGQAWELDHLRPVALYLRGWALAHCGHETEGKSMMELAHLIPLGDDRARHELYGALMKRGLSAEAARERVLITRVGEFMSWERSDALRQAGDEASGKEEFLAAADFWTAAFLNNLSTNTGFVEPWANAMIPALVHKTRAMGLVRAGKLEAALREADIAMADTPGDADALIDVTNELQKSGHMKEADAFFARCTAPYEKLIADHPASGPLHNLLAWSEARTLRHLDDAVAHGERAVALEPDNTASLDTLAEAYFARGQVHNAVDTIAKCIALEPMEPHHRKQMERFQAAPKESVNPAASSPSAR